VDAFEIAQGARRPSLAYRFTQDGVPVDLTGATSGTFSMRQYDGTAIVASGSVALTVPLTSGSAVYHWGSADTTTIGDYRGRISVYFPTESPLDSPEFAIRVYAYAPDRSTPGAPVELGPIIRRIRRLLDDSPGAEQDFDDADISEVAQRQSVPVYDMLVSPVMQRSNGSAVWHDYYLDGAYSGGTSLAVRTSTGVDIAGTAYTTDLNTGLIRFTANTGGSAIFVTGTRYNVGNAAADLLQQVVTRMARAYDVTMDGQSFMRSQVYRALRERIAELRGADSSGNGDVIGVKLVRDDMPGDMPGGQRIFDQTNADGRKVYVGGRYQPQPPGGSYPV
jgi:hypothetical protein